MNQQKRVSGRQLVEQCVKLIIQACKITQQCYENNDVKKYDKGGGDDPVTEADFKIQTMIKKGLKKVWSSLQIIGEEQIQFNGEIKIDNEKLENFGLPQEVILDNEYEIEDLCVWIDPIDNTRGFIKGQAEAVTNLIGISYGKKAEIGIIGVPFKRNEGKKVVYDPSVFIGVVGANLAFEYAIKKNEWKKLRKIERDQNYVPKIAVSARRNNIIEGIIQDKLKGERIGVGGAGYKVVLVVNGIADLLLYCECVTKKWDTCAGHAIIEAMGGFMIDQKGDQIIYDPQAKCYESCDGLICGLNQGYKKVAIETYQENNKKSIL